MRPALRFTALCSATLLAALGTLTACAPLPTTPSPPGLLTVGRAQLVLPPGEWVDFGTSDQALKLLPEVGATLPLQTRTVGLRGQRTGTNSPWLAVLQVQTNSTNYPRAETRWTDTSHVRIDCLRFKRWASQDGWMQANQPVLAQWLLSHQAAPAQAYSHLHYRYATQGGAYVDIQAVVDQRLLSPPTRNNQEFLAAGRPGQAWIHALALAGRQSTAQLDGKLSVPAFPIALPLPR